jgi:hypothetical protein
LVGKPGPLQAETDPETVAYLSNQIQKREPFNCESINYSKKRRILVTNLRASFTYKHGKSLNFATHKKPWKPKRGLSRELRKTNKELEDYAK